MSHGGRKDAEKEHRRAQTHTVSRHNTSDIGKKKEVSGALEVARRKPLPPPESPTRLLFRCCCCCCEDDGKSPRGAAAVSRTFYSSGRRWWWWFRFLRGVGGIFVGFGGWELSNPRCSSCCWVCRTLVALLLLVVSNPRCSFMRLVVSNADVFFPFTHPVQINLTIVFYAHATPPLP